MKTVGYSIGYSTFFYSSSIADLLVFSLNTKNIKIYYTALTTFVLLHSLFFLLK